MMDTSSRIPRSPAPRLIFLFATLTLTVAATILLCGAIMSDHWEEVYWDREILDRLNVSPRIRWYLDDKVGKLDSAYNNRPRVDEDHRVVQTIGNAPPPPPPPPQQQQSHSVVDAVGVHLINKHNNDKNTAPAPAFIVPMHGGIWTLCVSLTDLEIELLGQVDFPQERCINYLKPDEAHEELRAAWQNRMQNLSISCSLVCLIILGSAVIVGFFGLCRHQISAVLITGVMYLLAAIFALFTLMILYNKRSGQDRNSGGGRVNVNGPEDGVVGGPVDRHILKARRFAFSWSMDFGWGGVTLSALASIAWILLSKIMRFSPIAAMIA
ncbi:uncharacterized protein LOC106657102 [Trichogramma pretiosum]|uniref:uncharacterized protein LOC106657102 n=1 Tax=Trichogramma pretiosum TaxID=7493 RepID=UPI0006C96D14|nr:uncharacterized protein LOC106657102 [Trichogramma pretiosum]